MSKIKDQTYQGFEQGPIRPPSEADSLLIRVTRNCPWNRCSFCAVYKKRKFSLRPVDHVIRDIDKVASYVEFLQDAADREGRIYQEDVENAAALQPYDGPALQAALHWMAGGRRSIFIQDANSLIIKPKDLIRILRHLRDRFPHVRRITSYARSHTVARISDGHLRQMATAGLNRIHIGMESGSDRVLSFIQKGTTKQEHIKAGRKVKKAGMELSEYVMPGMGGKKWRELHARETADALNQINPDFIRLRTLAVSRRTPLHADQTAGRFEKTTDTEIAQEILLFLQCLDGITSFVKSDHFRNLLEEVDGRFPQDKERLCRVVQRFLDMPPQDRVRYQMGRRMGLLRRLDDMNLPGRLSRIDQLVRQLDVTPENVDAATEELMSRFL